MIKQDVNIFNGYIEGYYGRLLNWKKRKRIVNKLYDNGLNSYLYCPKEDPYHRSRWRKDYPKTWYKNFKNFCINSNKLNINILVGLSPALTFDFNNYKADFEILLLKSNNLVFNGAKYIVLQFDDIPNNFSSQFRGLKSEGYMHAKLTNQLYEKINQKIFVVPRIYADEISESSSSYLSDFCKNLNKDIYVFYSGKKIVSDTTKRIETSTIRKLGIERIIMWDNLFANDYCPKRIFLGTNQKRYQISNVMFNLTGMIETDLFLIDLITQFKSIRNNSAKYKEILTNNNIPYIFIDIRFYFYIPHIDMNKLKNKNNNYTREIEALDFLLWEWKCALALEWYPYLLGLKQDLQYMAGLLTSDRIRKQQTLPLSHKLLEYD